MRHIKDGVEIKCMCIRLLDGLITAKEVYIDAGEPFTITSITDGKHMSGSLHYVGQAADLRTRDLRNKTGQQMVDLLRAKLGKDYDVVLEKDHIHLEYQKKAVV